VRQTLLANTIAHHCENRLSCFLPFRQERFAASTGMTGITGTLFSKIVLCSPGNGMVPK
jgi:hypothetical protein